MVMANKPDPTKDPEFQKVVRHFVTTRPKPHKEMKIGKRKAKDARSNHSEIIFDTDSFDEELKRLGALTFKNFLETRGSVCLDLSFDIFVSKNVPAGSAGPPGQVFLGIRISGRIKKDVVA
ncbi:MAG: hypothetical protein WBW81_06760 [Methylocella sp.]